MPTYSEIANLVYGQQTSLNALRLHYMQKMVAHTKRPLVVYAANTQSTCLSSIVNDTDMRALMDTLHGIKGNALDLMLHSNGGSPYAADSFVSYLREKFTNIRVFVPQQAMSAATMIACGANEWVLAKHSFLGPIDLQLEFGEDLVAAQEVLDQYNLIRQEITDGNQFWTGTGRFYLPTLLVQCQNALEFGREVAEQHLREVMFAGFSDADVRAKRIANDLGDHTKHKMHGRRLSRRYLQGLGLKIVALEDDQDLQELVLSVHHCVMHTLEWVPFLTKLVLNHLGTLVPTFSPKSLPTLRKQGLDFTKLKDAFLNHDDLEGNDAESEEDCDADKGDAKSGTEDKGDAKVDKVGDTQNSDLKVGDAQIGETERGTKKKRGKKTSGGTGKPTQ